MARIFILVVANAMALCAARDSRVADAAMNGDREAVRTLVAAKADVQAPQGDGMTALHWAVYRDDLKLTQLLLDAGADVKAATRNGAVTPLFLACENGSANVISALLAAGADANSTNANGTTALMIAAASGSVDAAKVLLDKGAKIDAKESASGQTALIFAAALNRDAAIRLLAARGANLNASTNVRKLERVRFDQDGNVVDDKPGAAPAAPAAPKGSTLEETKADLNVFAKSMGFTTADYRPAKARVRAGDAAARAPRKIGADFMGGMSPLLFAAREGHISAVRALVEAGANVNQISAGDKMSPMVMAIINGHLEIGKYLLDRGANPNLVSITGITALYATIDVQWAPKAWYPQPSTEQQKVTYLVLMKALLDKGANVDAPVAEKPWFRAFTNDYTWVDPAGATPLWRAAQSSDIVGMRLLIAHGANPKIATKAGDLPLHAAAGIGWAGNWSVNAPYPWVEAVKYCVELGNDVNAADLRGYTALHGAAYLGDNVMVQYLVDKGARTDVKSKGGDSVADMANGPTRFGQPHPETAALLEKLGSPNSHNCRSDQCVVAAKAQVYDRRTPADYAAGADLDSFAKSLGFRTAEYRVDLFAGKITPEVQAIPLPVPLPSAEKKTGGGN